MEIKELVRPLLLKQELKKGISGIMLDYGEIIDSEVICIKERCYCLMLFVNRLVMSYNNLNIEKNNVIEQELIGESIKLIKDSCNKIIVVSIIKEGKYVLTYMILDEKSNTIKVTNKMIANFTLSINKNQIALLDNTLLMIGEDTLLLLDMSKVLKVNKENNGMGDELEIMFKSKNYQGICCFILSKSNGKYTLDKYKHVIEFAVSKLEEISTPRDPNSLNYSLTQLMISIVSPDSSASLYTYLLTKTRDKRKKARVLIAKQQSSLTAVKGIFNAVLERIATDSRTIKNRLELKDVREIDNLSLNQVVKKMR